MIHKLLIKIFQVLTGQKIHLFLSNSGILPELCPNPTDERLSRNADFTVLLKLLSQHFPKIKDLVFLSLLSGPKLRKFRIRIQSDAITFAPLAPTIPWSTCKVSVEEEGEGWRKLWKYQLLFRRGHFRPSLESLPHFWRLNCACVGLNVEAIRELEAQQGNELL